MPQSNTPNSHENPLGAVPINTLLARFAIPSIIATLVSALYNIVDQFFIGRSVGMLGNASYQCGISSYHHLHGHLFDVRYRRRRQL